MQLISGNRSAIVVGAGIVGLAMARALAIRNYKVTVIDRTAKAIGASIRNFGMVWPVGQPDGELYERAMLSKQIWKEVAAVSNIWYEEKGSLHLAYSADEQHVIEELKTIYSDRHYEIIQKDQVAALSPSVVTNGLLGALYSKDEMIVNPKVAIDQIASWLKEQYSVEFVRQLTAISIDHPTVNTGNKMYTADEIYVCNGADLETLYPDFFKQLPITKCKLQMMRLESQPDQLRIGPSLCGALSLLHYQSFQKASTLSSLRSRLTNDFPEHIKYGIHVMVSQNNAGELTVGDSHEYGEDHDPFDKKYINELILSYLGRFAHFKNNTILETWNGIYAKLTDGRSHIIHRPQQGVTIVNGVGGVGMTLSFGLCEQLAETIA